MQTVARKGASGIERGVGIASHGCIQLYQSVPFSLNQIRNFSKGAKVFGNLCSHSRKIPVGGATSFM